MLAAIFFGQSTMIQPIDDFAVAATGTEQALHLIPTGTSTLVARHPKVIELADEIVEDDGTVERHGVICTLLPRLFPNSKFDGRFVC